MATIRRHLWLEAPAQTVWQLVGNSSAIAEWVPSIASCEIRGDERTLVLRRGGTVVETIINRDDALRRMQYSVSQGLPVTEHLGTVDVIEVSAGRSLLIYSTDVKPDSIARAINAAIDASLQILEGRFGASNPPRD